MLRRWLQNFRQNWSEALVARSRRRAEQRLCKRLRQAGVEYPYITVMIATHPEQRVRDMLDDETRAIAAACGVVALPAAPAQTAPGGV